MDFSKIFSFMTPKDNKFMPLFVEGAEMLVQASEKLVEVTKETNRAHQLELIKEIKILETKGDDVTHKIYDELNNSFITPFDREDIHQLASTVDDVLDLIDGTAQRIDLLQPKHMPPSFKKMSEYIYLAAIEIRRAMFELNNLKRPENIKNVCMKINTIENQADDLFHAAIKDLFENEKDAIELIKLRDIIITMETCTDIEEDVADVIKTILIKNA